MSQEPARFPAWAVVAAGAAAIVHAVFLFAAVATLAAAAPKLRAEYADWGLKVPWVTDRVIEVGVNVSSYSWLFAVVGLVIVGLDVAVFLLLARSRRTWPLAWLWVIGVTAALMAAPVWGWYVLLLPRAKLMQGLTQ